MKYRAFISYRRQDASGAARWLREKLLRFRPPAELLDRVTPERRVDLERRVAYFLDTSYQSANEDFWTANIEPALRASEYLIVISSPSALRAREDGSDNWVAREIDTFLEVWGEEEGRRRIVLVLAPGAPGDRFPGRLGELGGQWDWADLRSLSRAAWLRPGVAERLGDALLKILARIHEVSQELLPILRQEEARKRGRVRAVAGAVAAAAMLTLGGMAWWAMEERSRAVEERNVAVANQSRFLAQLAEAHLAQGDFAAALGLALEAAPRGGRPYVAEAERALYAVINAPARQRAILGRHDNASPNTLAFSPDGRRLVSVTASSTVHIWTVAGGAPPVVLRDDARNFDAAWFSSDGRMVQTVSSNTTRLWDADSGRPLHTLRGKSRASAAGGVLLTIDDKVARLWDAATGTQRRSFGKDTRIDTSALSPQGQVVAIAMGDAVVLWDAASGEELRTLSASAGAVGDIAFSPDGRRLLIVGEDRTARIWDTLGGAELAVLRGHDDRVMSAAFIEDGAGVVTTSFDGTVRLWDAAGGRMRAVLRVSAFGEPYHDVSRDGKRLLTTGADRVARVWDVASGRELFALRGPEGHTAIFSPTEPIVAHLAFRGDIWLWTIDARPQSTVLRDDAATTSAAPPRPRVRFSPDGARVLSWSIDGPARLWTLATRTALTLSDSAAIADALFSADGRQVLATFGDEEARRWDAQTGEPIGTMGRLVALSPDGRRAVALAQDDSASLWDVAANRALAKLADGKVSAGFSSDGRRLFTMGMAGGSVQIWDGETGRALKTVGGLLPDAESPEAISPDGRWLLTGVLAGGRLHDVTGARAVVDLEPDIGLIEQWSMSADGTRVLAAAAHARVWDSATGRLVSTLDAKGQTMMAGALSSDGRLALTGTYDGRVILWQATSGLPLTTLHTHASEVSDVAFAPDGRGVASASGDGTVRVARVFRSIEELVEHACALMVRPLDRAQRRELGLEPDPKDPPCGWHPDMKDRPPRR